MNFHSTTIFLQDACLLHQYIRSKDTSAIVERPERLRALNIGIATLCARLELLLQQPPDKLNELFLASTASADEHVLVDALGKLNIQGFSQYTSPFFPIQIHRSKATLNLLNHSAVKFVHGDIERDVYLESLIKWSKESRDKIAADNTEIPQGLPQGDLYLCPASVAAIQGALATVCEAVDSVVLASRLDDDQQQSGQPPSNKRAFVAIRPPGHHCGENTPSGFCFVNNVVVGAAHAYLKHNIKRVIIFDIDLHHGNGTQSLIWQINEESYRQQLETTEGRPSSNKPGMQVFYGSLHDILSYPCEDGKPELVQAASVSIHGPHGQHIENIHLLPYSSEEQFWGELYEQRYSKLFERAATFIKETETGSQDDVLVFISCGFDACEHEHESMSRHGRKVPVGFYRRFARDARAFADRMANGRLISVLEGGYSDRALTSGIMTHVAGLVEPEDEVNRRFTVDAEWWNVENLETLEKVTKKRRGGRTSLTNDLPSEPWVQRTLEILATIDSNRPAAQPVVSSSSMSLRDRSKGGNAKREEKRVKTTDLKKNSGDLERASTFAKENAVVKLEPKQPPLAAKDQVAGFGVKDVPLSDQRKPPRVILKLGPPPSSSQSSASKPSKFP